MGSVRISSSLEIVGFAPATYRCLVAKHGRWPCVFQHSSAFMSRLRCCLAYFFTVAIFAAASGSALNFFEGHDGRELLLSEVIAGVVGSGSDVGKWFSFEQGIFSS